VLYLGFFGLLVLSTPVEISVGFQPLLHEVPSAPFSKLLLTESFIRDIGISSRIHYVQVVQIFQSSLNKAASPKGGILRRVGLADMACATIYICNIDTLGPISSEG
jgi:hypothetical protein